MYQEGIAQCLYFLHNQVRLVECRVRRFSLAFVVSIQSLIAGTLITRFTGFNFLGNQVFGCRVYVGLMCNWSFIVPTKKFGVH